MKGEIEERRWNLAWALPASLILHALIAAFLVYSLPRPAQQADQEQPVNVALVPPPEQPKPKPPTPQPKEPKVEKPPEPKTEKPPEQKVEKPPLPEKQPPKPPAIAVLKPVFHYGDKDTGPRKSLDGGGDRDDTTSPAKDNDSKLPVVPKPAENQSAAPADADQPADQSKADEKPVTAATDAKPTQNEEKQAAQDTDQQQADKQEAGAQTAEKQTTVAPTPSGAESDGKVELPAAAEKPKPKPVNTLKFRSAKGSKSRSRSAGTPGSTNAAVAGSSTYSGLPGVRKLYSQGVTGDALAASSMSGVPRDQRVANLCGSVLNQELQEASYSPKWLPSIPLKVGNVLAPPVAAFSTTTTWYRLGFRCEVDADATRVLSFSFRVGAEIPPGEWARLRLPSLH
ncbi:DUF930 domain-containing protein [Mesorhizobium sp.]|uniref:DUF930 domain-containing protein n=1 Tax=Mesorhizobium sp. TaxID=1871066 RepID=UPI000FE47F27|nr:DUF930 domain-containing protein [Mesorhizobium sp.]RWA72708.1 MAG: DUF930 domain-containing protein [Mesorhizobium sp.]RWA83074.1 MAG: DUF930 domain-containing protein [Mesorhizobium sp.]